MKGMWRIHTDALTALLGIALAIGIIWWMLATLNAVR